MLGQILNKTFINLLDDIAMYFRVNEQNDFESCELANIDSYCNHDYLKYIDLALALSDAYIELDIHLVVRLIYLSKYTCYICCNYGNDEVDLDNPNDYTGINQILKDKEFDIENYPDYKFILWKYEYQ